MNIPFRKYLSSFFYALCDGIFVVVVVDVFLVCKCKSFSKERFMRMHPISINKFIKGKLVPHRKIMILKRT